jgi:hypothetical protein
VPLAVDVRARLHWGILPSVRLPVTNVSHGGTENTETIIGNTSAAEQH